MRPHRSKVRAATLLAFVSLPFLIRPELVGGDEPHYAALTWSVAADGDFDPANQYAQSLAAEAPAAGRRFLGKPLDEHLADKPAGRVSSHPLGLPALAAPVLAVAVRLGLPGMPDLALGLLTALVSFLGYRAFEGLLGRWLCDARGARVTAAITFFSTPLWFYGRTYFTEPYVAALLVIACWAIARQRPVAAGLLLGAAIAVKDQALIPALCIAAIAAMHLGRRRSLALLPGFALAGVAFVARNLLLYGSGWIDFPQNFKPGSIAAGAIGLAIDPARGLLFFAPVCLLAFLAFRKEGADRVTMLTAGACFLAFYLLNASWIDWRGGSGFGPRLLVPVLPLLALPIGLIWKHRREDRFGRGTLCLLAAAGFALEVVAISTPFRAFWSPTVSELAFSSPTRAVTFAAAFVAGYLWCRNALRSGGETASPDPLSERGAGT